MSEVRPAEVYAELVDTVADDFDRDAFLDTVAGRAAALLGVTAAGVLSADQPGGALRRSTGSSGPARHLTLLQLHTGQGPCVASFHTGETVCVAPADAGSERWPIVAAAATEAGLGAVYAIPLRVRDDVLGAMALYARDSDTVDRELLRDGQALARVTAIGLLHRYTVDRRDILIGQLQTALDSRVVIEQAKGVLAERLGVDLDHAFALLRGAARRDNRRLPDLCHTVVQRRDAGAVGNW